MKNIKFEELTKADYKKLVTQLAEKSKSLIAEKTKVHRNKNYQEKYGELSKENYLLKKKVERLKKYESMYKELAMTHDSMERSNVFFRAENAKLRGSTIDLEIPDYLLFKKIV